MKKIMLYESFLDWFKSKKEEPKVGKSEEELENEIQMRIAAGEKIEELHDKVEENNDVIEYISDKNDFENYKISNEIVIGDDVIKITIANDGKEYHVDINEGEIKSVFYKYLSQDEKHIRLLHDITSIAHMTQDDRND
jgi:hypothetical protein